MDTKKDSSVSDVPTFKVARVGEDRKRKGGGFSFLRGGGSRGAWSGATGGSGAAGGAGGVAGAMGMNFTKVMLTLIMTATVGSGAVYLGARSAANVRTAGDKKPAIFSDKGDIKLEGDTSNLPSNSNSIPNSLGYLTGSRDGLTPEERAKKEAEAAAAAEAQRIADEEAAKKAEAERTAGNGVDPNALLASAKADGGSGRGGSAFGKKFGSLSSSMGGGSSLSGGAGLSGGVNRSFGGAGSLGKPAAGGGQMTAMKGAARPSYSKAGGARMASSKTKGFARKQLANANAYSRRASSASKGETAASDAGTAFDNNPGAGNVISGPGVGKGSGSSTGADSTPNSVDNGGPTGNTPEGPVDCGADMYLTADGGCAPINTGAGKDAKPALTMMANIVMGLLIVIGIISAIALACEGTVFGYAFAKVVETAIFGLSLAITGLGVAMMAMGDYVTGGIATLLGGVIAGFAYWNPGALTPGYGLVAGFGGAALSMVGKMLDAGNHKEKAPVAAQQ